MKNTGSIQKVATTGLPPEFPLSKRPKKKQLSKEEEEQKRREKEEREQKRRELVEYTSEERALRKEISNVERVSLEKVFQMLCTATDSNPKFRNTQTSMAPGSTQSEKNSNSNINQQQNFIQDFFTCNDIMCVLNELDYFPSKREVEEIIWDVDDSMTGRINWYEFLLMYKRCSFDETGIEQTDLFRIVQFLMYLQKNQESLLHDQNNFSQKQQQTHLHDTVSELQQENSNQNSYQKSYTQFEAQQLQQNPPNQQLQQQDKKQEFKQFFSTNTITFDNALELLFVRYGKKLVNQKIYDIFGVVMDGSVVTKDDLGNKQQKTNKNAPNTETSYKVDQAFEKTLTLEKYLEIMKKIEFEQYQNTNKERMENCMNPYLEESKSSMSFA